MTAPTHRFWRRSAVSGAQPPQPRVGRRLLAVLGLLAGLASAALLLASPASAHATVSSSTPQDGSRLQQAPRSVSVTFDEGVGLGDVGYLRVTNQTGTRVDTGGAKDDGRTIRVGLRAGLGDGTYTASFRVVSADSHPVAGTVAFVVGDGALVRGSASASGGNHDTESALDTVRWLSYAGFAALGGAWIVLTVWAEGRDDRRARTLLWGGWAALAAGTVLELLLQGPYTAGKGPASLLSWTYLDGTLHTDYGALHSARLLLLGLLGFLLAVSLRPEARRAPWEGIAALVGVGIAATFSAAGHAGTTDPAALSIPLDMLHLLAMAAWVGALLMLALAVFPRRDADELRRVVPVVSKVAFGSVVVLASTGTYAAWRGIGSVDAILDTTYGRLVLLKVTLFLGMLGAAGIARAMVQRRLAPRRVAFANTDTELPVEDELAVHRLKRSVQIEAGLALVVLAFTATLVSSPRGNEALAASYREPVTVSTSLGGGRTVEVTADPGVHGQVSLTVDVPKGAAPTSITARATQVQRGIGPIPVTLTRANARSFQGTGALTVAGRWRLDLVVQTSAFDAVTADVEFTLH